MRVTMHDSIRLEQQAAAWRVRIKRQLRKKRLYVRGSYERFDAISAAIDTLTPGRPA